MSNPASAADTPPSPPLVSTRPILASAALLGAATVVAKLAALARDWLVARDLGVGDDLDAFFVAFIIPSYACVVLAHSFAPAFVPEYIRLARQQGPAAARHLLTSALAAAGALLIVVTFALAVAGRWLLPLLGRGFDADKLALTGSLYLILIGVLVVSGFSAVFAAALNAHERFAATAWPALAMPVCSFLTLAVFEERYGIAALAAGTLLGFAIECAILAAQAWRHGLLGGVGANAPHSESRSELRHVVHQYVPLVFSGLLMSSSLVVDQSMAASLGGGNVSALNYGNKIVAFVLSIAAVSLSTALLPRFSHWIAAGQWSDLERTLRRAVAWTFAASIPGLILLALLSEPLVRLLFQHGAFTSDTTLAVSRVQLCYLPQIPFYILAMIGGRVLSALGANRTVLAIGALNLAMNVAGNYVLMHFFGASGIALSTSLMYLVAAIVTLWAIRRQLAAARRAPATTSA